MHKHLWACLALYKQTSKEGERQVIVNNYYISDKEIGWKQLMEGEILPNISGNVTQRISSEISQNKTAMEHSNRQSKTNTEEKGLNINQEVKATAKAMKSTHTIEEPTQKKQRYKICHPLNTQLKLPNACE